MSNGTVLIAGNFDFPNGNAAGKRVLGLGYTFKDIGYDVAYLGCKRNRGTNIILDTKQAYESFDYYNFNGGRGIRDICNVGGAFSEFKEVISDIGIKDVKLIILYGSPVLAIWIKKVISFGKENNIPVVFDCVDWIEKSGFDNWIKDAIKYIDTNYMKRVLACRCNGVIAISKYLYDYYAGKGCKTVMIPPIGKSENDETYITADNQEKSSPVKILYAGSMMLKKGKGRECMKDRIDITLDILGKIYEKDISFFIDIFGIEKEEYVSAIPEQEQMLNAMSSQIRFHGKTPNEEVCQYIKEADFTILNRIETKVTTAGFPSKVSESLLLGTPVITNSTSNIADYINDGENGLIIDFDLEKAATQIAELFQDKSKIRKMKQTCVTQCCFDYHGFESTIRDFTEGIMLK